MRIKYLHLMSNDKFIVEYIKLIEKNFIKEEHFFLIIGGISYLDVPIKNNILYYKTGHIKNKYIRKIYEIWGYFYLFYFLKNSKQVIIHGLFNQIMIVFLFFNLKALKKCKWIIWGGDLYSYRKRKENCFYKIFYKIDSYVKRNMNGYITHIEGDYKLAKKWYGAKGKYYDCFVYPSNLYKEISNEKYKKDNKLNIQIGNSADPSNNHLEIIDKLEKYEDQNIKCYCILAYGNKEWAKKVCLYGKKKLGKRFIPIMDFMPYDKYIKFISKIDIAIFAHDRQQGLGNITALLGMGKTVYIKKNITTYEVFNKLGINIKSFETLESIELLSEKEKKDNENIIKEVFSEKNLTKQWEKIFND